MGNTLVRVIQYIRHLKIPLVWEFNNCVVTMYAHSFNKLRVTSTSTNVGCQEAIFDEDTGILHLVLFLSQCTTTGKNEDGTFISDQEIIMERIKYVLTAPADIDKVAGWLIEQYEAGNTEPLVSRVQTILGTVFDHSMLLFEEDKKVCAYYQNHISRELFDNAFNAMTNARINLVKLSTLRPIHKPKGN